MFGVEVSEIANKGKQYIDDVPHDSPAEKLRIFRWASSVFGQNFKSFGAITS